MLLEKLAEGITVNLLEHRQHRQHRQSVKSVLNPTKKIPKSERASINCRCLYGLNADFLEKYLILLLTAVIFVYGNIVPTYSFDCNNTC